jgi:hypothetical protein
MKSITLIISNASARKFRHLNSESKRYLMDEVDNIISDMPLESEIEASCQTNAQNTKHCSQHGLINESFAQSAKRLSLLALLLLSTLNAFSAKPPAPSRVTERLIEAVCQVESNGRATAIGDGGKASGAFQFWSATWQHTTQIRQRDGLPTTSYKEGSKDIKWSRLYAASYLRWIEKYIRDRGVKYPTAGQIYMGYNWGVGNARKVKFDVSKSPATTQRAIRKIEAWLRK